MIEQELLFLGLLKESPKHGYRIKKEIREILSLFAGLAPKSVYYPLGILEKKGLVLKHINNTGRRPQRFVYGLTPKGDGRFKELLNKSLLDFKRPQFNLDLSLYFLRYMQPDIARRRLRARMSILKKISKGLLQMAGSLKKNNPCALAHILEHNRQMVETEFQFLKQFIRIF